MKNSRLLYGSILCLALTLILVVLVLAERNRAIAEIERKLETVRERQLLVDQKFETENRPIMATSGLHTYLPTDQLLDTEEYLGEDRLSSRDRDEITSDLVELGNQRIEILSE